VHTGDWRIDLTPEIGPPTNEARLRQLGDAGVLALICDSTNAVRDGESPSEQAVGASLRKIISESRAGWLSPPSPRMSAASARSPRPRAIPAAGSGHGPFAQARHHVADELGYMEGLPPSSLRRSMKRLPRDKLVLICTGSQGEPQAAWRSSQRTNSRRCR
jgi:ribonuclease J